MRNSITFILCFTCYLVSAQVKLPEFFSDNMVLQRDKAVGIWGSAGSGEKVSVKFAGQTKTTTTDKNGNWSVKLSSLKQSALPADMTVEGTNTITLKNILVGDVWLCSGQSNMEYPLDRSLKKYLAPAKGPDLGVLAVTESKPNTIRYLYVERTLNRKGLPTKGWADGNDTIVKWVSAIGYFFAKEIQASTNVPIGIISSSWGGTRIEQWTPDWAYERAAFFKDSITSKDFKIDGMHPGQMFNKLIAPLAPFGIKGVLWYQGESNAMVEDQSTYPEKFSLFVNTWRDLFEDKNLPFYYVQVAPHLYTSRKDAKKHTVETLPQFWEAQSRGLEVSNTGMVVTTDLVDKLSEIHPSYKWEIAHRLALWALAKDYGKRSLEYSGPIYKSMKIKEGKIYCSFSHAGNGLKAGDGQALTNFSIAGEDGIFVPAQAVINGKQVVVSSEVVSKPLHVRFAWDEKAQPNFFNTVGLPASPFRTKL